MRQTGALLKVIIALLLKVEDNLPPEAGVGEGYLYQPWPPAGRKRYDSGHWRRASYGRPQDTIILPHRPDVRFAAAGKEKLERGEQGS